MPSRRDALKLIGAGALGAMAPALGASAASAQGAPPLLMDGHVHIINRVYWEGIDAWQEQPGIGWDYARARKARRELRDRQYRHLWRTGTTITRRSRRCA